MQPRATRAVLLAGAGIAGAGTMVLELASVRALAPFYGASTEVWTSAIGTVLLALASGYALGGWAAERGHVFRRLGVALCGAGITSAMAPIAVAPVARLFLPDDLRLADALPLLRSGTIVTEGVLFGLPVFLLGFVEPLFVRALTDVAVPAGRASGLVLASSTLGGLAGTFGTTYLLVPTFGVRWTLVGCGVAIAVSGLAALWLERSGLGAVAGGTLAILVAGAIGVLSTRGPIRPARDGENVLADRESREQFLRVIERGEGNDREVWLQVNEGLDSFQSIDVPSRRTPGHYYDTLAFAATLARRDERTLRVAVIGAGAGTVLRSLVEMEPKCEIEGIEIDPDVVELGRRYFRLEELLKKGATMRPGVDGRAGLRAIKGGLDAVLIDAYARQVEIPFHLVSREMFDDIAIRLVEGGVVAINVSAFGLDDPVLRAIGATLADAMGRVLVLPVRRDHNFVLVARKGVALPSVAETLARARSLGASPVANLAQFLAGPGGAVEFARRQDDRALTDDCAPMEMLQRRSLELAREGGP